MPDCEENRGPIRGWVAFNGYAVGWGNTMLPARFPARIADVIKRHSIQSHMIIFVRPKGGDLELSENCRVHRLKLDTGITKSN